MKNKEYVEKLVNKVFVQAERGEVKIGNELLVPWTFYVKFHNNQFSKINDDSPVVQIKNKEVFLSNLSKYLQIAKKFYAQDKNYFELSGEGFDEKLVMDLFINATNFDLNNVEKYIEQRTKMLLDKSTKCGKFSLGEFLNCNIVGQITKNKSNLESPYKFSIAFENGQEKFLMPSVYFGKIDNKLMVYALQGQKEKQKNKLAKDLDRYFRKVNKDVDKQKDEMLSQVSPNGLVALTIFLAYQQQLGAKEVEAVNFMPIRYNSNETAGTRKLKTAEEKEEFLAEHDRNQFNISNRFLYTLIRYCFHFGNQCEYDDFYEKLNIDLSERKEKNDDNIIFDVDKAVVQHFEDVKQI